MNPKMKKILIVEDDLDIQDVFRIIFTSYGYQVECIDNGKTIFENNGDWPDAIILDKQLPGINGIDACKLLKANNETKNIPVIMISAASGIETIARSAGADDFLEKPFNMNIILTKVGSLLKQRMDGNKN
jgi:DNA-binding response OmpR family regulator